MKLIASVTYSPPDAFVGPGIVRRFLAWAQCADAGDRAEAASALARAYLYSDLSPSMRAEAAVAMTALLDDPSAIVRRALAEALASAREAPRHLVVALAADQSDVAAAVLGRSPVLTDAELVDCAAIGDVVAQCAIARRPNLGPGAAAALVEVGEIEAALTLIGNLNVDLPPSALRRLFERFGDDAETREALLARPLQASLKADIAAATARALSATAARWLSRERAERIAREVCEQAIATIAASCGKEERAELVRGLRKNRALTPALLLRSLLGGERDLFAAALAELTGMPLRRVAALMFDPRGEGFAALARKAGLGVHHLPVFRAAIAAIDERGRISGEGLKLQLVERVIAECEERRVPSLATTLSLLWRFAAEAARTQARIIARDAIASASAPRLPRNLDLSSAANDDRGAKSPATILIDPPTSAVDWPGSVVTVDEAGEDVAPRIEASIDPDAALDDESDKALLLTVALDSSVASVEAPELEAAFDGPDADAVRRLPPSLDFSPAVNHVGEAALSSIVFDSDSGGATERPIDSDRGDTTLMSSPIDRSDADAARPNLSAILEAPDKAAAPSIQPPIDIGDAIDAGSDAVAAEAFSILAIESSGESTQAQALVASSDESELVAAAEAGDDALDEGSFLTMDIEPSGERTEAQALVAASDESELSAALDEPDNDAVRRLPPSLDFSPAAND